MPTTLFRGMISPDVTRWQRFLGLRADGVFGVLTEAKTKQWQLQNGLHADGIVGPLTWEKAKVFETVPPKGTYPLILAKNFDFGRTKPISLIVIHVMQSSESPGRARAVAQWFAGPSAPLASAHYCVDDAEIIQCVADIDTAWHAPGANPQGIGIELAGMSEQSPEQWKDDYSRKVLRNAAMLTAQLCQQHKIQKRYIPYNHLSQSANGITGHNDVTLAFCNGRGHWDPGPHFPWDSFLAIVHSL